MATIELGTAGSSQTFEIGAGAGKKSKTGASISEFNKKLKAGAKEGGEKVDFAELDKVKSSERGRINTRDLNEYIERHQDDKAHIQEIFSPKSPLMAIYTKNDDFKPKDNLLQRLIGPLFKFLANPSAETLKGIAAGLVSSDGDEINYSDNVLFSGLESNQKLTPLATALRAIGLTDTASQMGEDFDANPEGLKEEYGAAAVEAKVKESLAALTSIFDESGNILQENGEVLMEPMRITAEDIRELGGNVDPESLTVKEGELKWDDFAANTFRYFAGKNPGKAIDYANTVMAIFNKKMAEKLEEAGTSEEKADVKSKNEEVQEIFAGKLGKVFGGEAFAKAFELSLSRGAFVSDSLRKTLVGNQAEIATQRALSVAAQDLLETADEKGNSLNGINGIIEDLVNGDGKNFTVLDLAKTLGKNPEHKQVQPNYDNNELTLADISRAYKKSAEKIATAASGKLAEEVVGTKVGDPEARKKYLAGGDDGKGGIKADVGDITTAANDDSKEHDEIFAGIDVSLKTITDGKFLVHPSQADKFASQLSKDIQTIVGFTAYSDDEKRQVGALTNTIRDQISNGEPNFKAIAQQASELFTEAPEQEAAKARIRNNFKDSDKTQSFISRFINNEEIQSLGSIVKATTIQDLVKSNSAIADVILKQAENKGLNVSSIEEIVDSEDKGLIADASPELALIFASADQVKDDNKRAEMAMLGLTSILKSEPSLLADSAKSKAIAKKLFSKHVKQDDYKATAAANKLSEYLANTSLEFEGLKRPDIEGDNAKKVNIEEAAKLAGSSLTRSQYLSFVAPPVAYAREAVTADKLARMINANTTSSARSDVKSALESVASHLESVANGLEGSSYEEVETKVLEGLEGTAKAIVKNMFYAGDEFDTLATRKDSLTGDKAPQTIMDAAVRLKMIIPRLYTVEKAERPAPQETA